LLSDRSFPRCHHQPRRLPDCLCRNFLCFPAFSLPSLGIARRPNFGLTPMGRVAIPLISFRWSPEECASNQSSLPRRPAPLSFLLQCFSHAIDAGIFTAVLLPRASPLVFEPEIRKVPLFLVLPAASFDCVVSLMSPFPYPGHPLLLVPLHDLLPAFWLRRTLVSRISCP